MPWTKIGGLSAPPKRIARFAGTSTAAGTATIVFDPPFKTLDDVDVILGWSGDTMISGGITAQSLTGCTVLVKVSRATLLLSAGPFQTAGAGVPITVRAIGI